MEDGMSEPEAKYEVEAVDHSPAAMIQAAIVGGADLDKLEKLMVLQERYEANEAKKVYVGAMAAFKANPPRIEKTKTVKYSNTEYKHALLADAAEKINKALSQHGLSASWRTNQAEKGITVTCTITHNMGYSESTELTAAPDTSGAKNAIQAIGSTVSYLERYTLFALTGLASHDMDDDAQAAATVYITTDQYNELHAMIEDNGLADTEAKKARLFGAYLKVESLDRLPAKQFNRAKAAIQGIIKKLGEAQK
jgi:hypothetical protein